MTARRSFDLKIDRAEEHLKELEHAVGRYCDRHPYKAVERMEGNQQGSVWRLRFTEQPDPWLTVIAGDFLYNVRSGLDHLAAALVPEQDWDYFPIYFQGV